MTQKLLCYTLLVLFLSGCSSKQPHTTSLYEQLIGIGVSSFEAQKLESLASKYTQTLHELYGASSFPLWNNLLINTGIKQKGLCYDYAFSLYAKLKQASFSSLDLYLIQSDKGKYFEHNAVAVCTDHVAFDECIVLDAWRDQKRLTFVQVKSDTYKWVKREYDKINSSN